MQIIFAKVTDHEIRLIKGMAAFFICLLFLFGGDLQAGQDQIIDPLMSPSTKTHIFLRRPIMGVANTGEALVAVGESGRIMVSKDHGISWVQSAVSVSVTFTAVDFPTAQHGWAVGHQGVILHTTDAGQTWEKQIDGTVANKLMLTAVKRQIKKTEEELETSTDERKEKLKQKLDDLSYCESDWSNAVKEGPTIPFLDVSFKNSNEGIAVGAFGMILQTSDGGKTWAAISDAISNIEGFHYYGIARSRNTIILAGENGGVFRSSDGGKSWKNLDTGYSGSFFGVACNKDESLIVAFGLDGNAYCSRDGGQNWDKRKASRSTIGAGEIFEDGTVWLADLSGTLLCSADAGRSFTAARNYGCMLPVMASPTARKPYVLPRPLPAPICLAAVGEDGSIVVGGMPGLTLLSPKK